MKGIKKYIKIWWFMSRNSFLTAFYAKFALLIFLTGKILRFSFFVLFLYFLMNGTESLAGYSKSQIIFFFLTFNLIDILGQFLFRGVYRFKPLVVNGDFDLILTKPISALFRSLMSGADVIDLITVPPLMLVLFWVGRDLSPTFSQIILYITLVLNGLLIAASFHIATISLGIVTMEVDYVVWMYRDLVSLGRLPVSIYRQSLQTVLTYVLPVAIMISFPVQAFFGLLSAKGIFIAFIVGIGSFFLSMKFWNWSLRKYTSASS